MSQFVPSCVTVRVHSCLSSLCSLPSSFVCCLSQPAVWALIPPESRHGASILARALADQFCRCVRSFSFCMCRLASAIAAPYRQFVFSRSLSPGSPSSRFPSLLASKLRFPVSYVRKSGYHVPAISCVPGFLLLDLLVPRVRLPWFLF